MFLMQAEKHSFHTADFTCRTCCCCRLPIPPSLVGPLLPNQWLAKAARHAHNRIVGPASMVVVNSMYCFLVIPFVWLPLWEHARLNICLVFLVFFLVAVFFLVGEGGGGGRGGVLGVWFALSIFLPTSLSFCLSGCLSAYLSIYSTYLPTYLSIPIYLSIYLSILSIYLSIYLSICLSIYLSII